MDPAADELLPPAVVQFLHTHDLYRPAATTRPGPQSRKVAIFIGSFDPPCRSRREAVLGLLNSGFDEVVIRPVAAHYGADGPEHVASMHRAALADLTFGSLPRVTVDFSELDRGPSDHPIHLEARFSAETDVYYAVRPDRGGRSARSIIQTRWERGGAGNATSF